MDTQNQLYFSSSIMDLLMNPVLWTVDVHDNNRRRFLIRIPEENIAKLKVRWLYEQIAKKLDISLERFRDVPPELLYMCPFEYKDRYTKMYVF